MNTNNYKSNSSLQKKFIKAGVNTGQSTINRDPCMLPFIIDSKNEHCIIDLTKTISRFELAKKNIERIMNSSGKILFISPDSKFHDLVASIANEHSMPYILDKDPEKIFEEICSSRTAKKKINFYRKIEESNYWKEFSKFEKSSIIHEIDKLEKLIKLNISIERLPQAVFIIDPEINNQIIFECQKFGIITFSLVNTNTNPAGIDFFIPANNQDFTAVNEVLSVLFSFTKDNILSEEYLNKAIYDIDNELTNAEKPKEEKHIKKSFSDRVTDRVADFFNDSSDFE